MGDIRETAWRRTGGDGKSQWFWDKIIGVLGGIAAIIAAVFSALCYFRR